MSKEDRGRILVFVTAIFLLVTVIYSSNLSSPYSVYSQETENGTTFQTSTSTECAGIGIKSESEADTLLSLEGNRISQECEQIISSQSGNNSRASNYATNRVQIDNDVIGENRINQESKQK
ncbi:MAG: hypothetical protein ACRD5E_07985 [Nitrososphaeraceae archaeon]